MKYKNFMTLFVLLIIRLTDDEDDSDVDDTYNDDYSYTFEATATETATASGLPTADVNMALKFYVRDNYNTIVTNEPFSVS